MIPENRIPTHPGVILSQEFLAPLGVTQVAFAKHLGVPVQRGFRSPWTPIPVKAITSGAKRRMSWSEVPE